MNERIISMLLAVGVAASAAVLPQFVSAADVLIPDASGRVTTEKFTVADREGEALGVLLRADQKFWDAAASVDLSMDGRTLTVKFTCPIPAGMKVEKVKNCAWSGDWVEFQFRPSWNSPLSYQYCINAAGTFRAFKNTSPGSSESGWQSAAKTSVEESAERFVVTLAIPCAEVFPEPPGADAVSGINFARGGKTAGGWSTWVKSCAGATAIDAYGSICWGGEAAYRAAQAKEREKRDAIKRKFAASPLLAYLPDDIVGNALEPNLETKVLESLRLVVPRGTRRVMAFVLQNRLEKWYLGQLKLFDGTNVCKRFSRAGTNVVARCFSIARGFPTYSRDGRPDYDVVEPLPMGTVMRLAPGELAPVYLTFDARNVRPGEYRLVLAVKKAVEGYETLKIPVSVKVLDLDLAKTPCDKACYTYLTNLGDFEKNAAFLSREEYNVAQIMAHPYPFKKKDGSWSPQDFANVDRTIGLRIRGGIDPKQLKLWVFLGYEFSWLNPRTENGSGFKKLSPEWKEAVRHRLDALIAHVDEKFGIGRDRLIWYVCDEPDGDIHDPTFKSKISLCYNVAKFLKATYPDVKTFTDPNPHFLASKEGAEPIRLLKDAIDIIELHRPSITPLIAANVKAAGFAETWTYAIVGKGTPAASYRRWFWENLRDGYRELCPFWHLDESAGWDMFDPSDSDRPGRYQDYASVYADHDLGTQLLSRRQLWYDQGFEDARLILTARRLLKGDAARLARVEALVKAAADEGTMAAMDRAAAAILETLVP